MNDYIKYLEKEFLKLRRDGVESVASSGLYDDMKCVISKGASINIRPYEIERSGFKLGKVIKKEPASLKNIYKYHFNNLNKVSLIEILDGDLVDKEFYLYKRGEVVSYFFDSAGDIRNINLSLVENDIFIMDFNYGKFGYSISEYIYNDGILKAVNVFQKEHDTDDGSTYVSKLEYSNGGLESVTNIFPNNYREVIYP